MEVQFMRRLQDIALNPTKRLREKSDTIAVFKFKWDINVKSTKFTLTKKDTKVGTNLMGTKAITNFNRIEKLKVIN